MVFLIILLKGGIKYMDKHPALLYKGLVVCVIVLFVGVGVQPAVANVSNSITDEDDDCDICPRKVSKSQLLFLKILKDKLKKIEKTVIFFPGINREIKENIKELSDITNVDSFTLLGRPDRFCDLFEKLKKEWFNNLDDFLSPFENNIIIFAILSAYLDVYFLIFYSVIYSFFCDDKSSTLNL